MDDEPQESYAALLHLLDAPAREAYRKLERIKRKLIQSTYSGQFNKVCIDEELLPNYSNI